jgi:hypothetical protein
MLLLWLRETEIGGTDLMRCTIRRRKERRGSVREREKQRVSGKMFHNPPEINKTVLELVALLWPTFEL